MASICGTKTMKFFCAGSDSKMRIIHTRLLALLILVLLLVSRNTIEGRVQMGLLDFAGLICVIISAFGRVWSSVYIAGYKTSALVESGPYSVTRNPLYLFSLIGTVGVGLASGSILILVLLMLCFGIYYPFVIRREETNLGRLHGPEFLSYMERVPRFLPKLSLYSEPETYTVKPKLLRRALLDASYFVWVFGVVQLIENLRETGVFPALFRIP
jgi:protein-S-isoprenylcysteine O-methyltransferase Ste14